jgi:hypothetical protein
MQTTQRQAQPVLVGTSLPRLDGLNKVTGRARYAGDQGSGPWRSYFQIHEVMKKPSQGLYFALLGSFSVAHFDL